MLTKTMNCLLGIFSPMKHDLHSYLGYSIDNFLDNIRFVEIIISREGGGGNTAPLFFNGACDFFAELPLPNDGIGIAKVYSMLDSIRQPKKVAMFLFKNDELKEEEKSYRESNRNFWNVWRGKNNKYHN